VPFVDGYFCSECFQVFKSDFDVRLSHCSTFDQLKTQPFQNAYSTSASSEIIFSLLQFVTIFKELAGKSNFVLSIKNSVTSPNNFWSALLQIEFQHLL
jgi:hypothetical protein